MIWVLADHIDANDLPIRSTNSYHKRQTAGGQKNDNDNGTKIPSAIKLLLIIHKTQEVVPFQNSWVHSLVALFSIITFSVHMFLMSWTTVPHKRLWNCQATTSFLLKLNGPTKSNKENFTISPFTICCWLTLLTGWLNYKRSEVCLHMSVFSTCLLKKVNHSLLFPCTCLYLQEVLNICLHLVFMVKS